VCQALPWIAERRCLMDDLTQAQIAAALCENVYRRSDNDQPLSLTDINAEASDVNLSDASPQGLTTDGSGYWYDNSTGFVGRVVDVNGTVYVVFRGTDWGTGGTVTKDQIVSAIRSAGTAGPIGAIDPLDFTRANLILGTGTAIGTQWDGSQPV